MMGVIESMNGMDGIQICLGTGSFYYDAIMDEFEERSVELSDNIKVLGAVTRKQINTLAPKVTQI